jgi:hypothetical protein
MSIISSYISDDAVLAIGEGSGKNGLAVGCKTGTRGADGVARKRPNIPTGVELDGSGAEYRGIFDSIVSYNFPDGGVSCLGELTMEADFKTVVQGEDDVASSLEESAAPMVTDIVGFVEPKTSFLDDFDGEDTGRGANAGVVKVPEEPCPVSNDGDIGSDECDFGPRFFALVLSSVRFMGGIYLAEGAISLSVGNDFGVLKEESD